jgi:imidazolonepropionase-like amidohydrolase
VAVHVYGGEAADNVIRGGADSVEHGFDLTDDQMRRMKEKGTVLVGTEFPEAHLAVGDPMRRKKPQNIWIACGERTKLACAWGSAPTSLSICRTKPAAT